MSRFHSSIKNSLFIIVSLLTLCSSLASAGRNEAPGITDSRLKNIKLPAGFRISVYASDVPGARSMVLSPSGTLFVGTRDVGNVYALLDTNNDNVIDRVITIASGLDMPNGVAFYNGALYVAEVSRVIRFDSIESRLMHPPAPVVVNDSFPSEHAHGWKFIRIGPDHKLYVPVGIPCNNCLRDDERFGTIMRMNLDGTGLEVFAKGIRNTVGFDWDPATKELWFTDNGRDNLGDNIPPDELNHAPMKGMNFGNPYCHGTNIPDPEFGALHPCSDFIPPAIELGPHVASLGMRFYNGAMFPREYKKRIFIAEHGSWNRSIPIGYRVTMVTVDSGKATNYQVFAEGWLQNDVAWGRPVDVLVMPDGSLLVSDDEGGRIYRVWWRR